MTTTTRTEEPSTSRKPAHGKLARNAIGTMSVVFMVVATAAPITAMAGNTPYIIGYGVGKNAPGVFLAVTIVLTIFSIGYVRLARHITTTGAFYGFVSHGLGRLLGLGSGVLALFAYLIFEVAIAGAFAYFADAGLKNLGFQIDWIWLALGVLVINSILAYFKINIGAAVLGVFLILEIAVLGLHAIGGLAHPAADGYMLETLNPFNAFTAIAGGSVGLAFFLGFWSWVGFESTAIYGEESRNPRRTVPLATYISVIGIGLFYTIVTWATVVTNGADHAISLVTSEGADPTNVFVEPLTNNWGSWAATAFYVLMVTGSFACSLAFHNSASRYLYALGRDNVARFMMPLGKTHHSHHSPYVASITQTIIAAVLVVILYVTGISAYDTFVLIGLMGTLSILCVQVLASIAVIGYFRKHHKDEWNWFTTFIAPVLSAIAMIGVIGLLIMNQESAVGGTAAASWLFPLIPYIVGILFVLALLWGSYLRSKDPEVYDKLGRMVLDTGDVDKSESVEEKS
ncbi:MAG: APC family permease [Microbacteriaceae bacterium]|nr:APC family permease [Cryobacterium sp.]MBX3103952.1 APC family permease [Cryobacterium sp.]MCC6376871.1 APC family permease [Microbacteriaceae bacterium]